MPYGLQQRTIEKLYAIFRQFPQVENVVLYGSRAKGNYRSGSDIDITLVGDSLTHENLLQISNAIDDALLPYQVDISIFNTIEHEDLRDHIHRVGVEFYKKPKLN